MHVRYIRMHTSARDRISNFREIFPATNDTRIWLIRRGIQSISRCAIYQQYTIELTFMIDRAIISKSCRKCKYDVSTGRRNFYSVLLLRIAVISMKFKLQLSRSVYKRHDITIIQRRKP